MTYRSSWMTEELDAFRDQFRRFLAKDLGPHAERWRKEKMVERAAWQGLGRDGRAAAERAGGLWRARRELRL